ncbi:hypothetical protein VNO80_14198 [Phaseolus coccineus]|uniref:Secreted protein n=1 Tax=Phaseolus coccineus TaxID=3886 RepID=A0AAN9MLE7_PHACN
MLPLLLAILFYLVQLLVTRFPHPHVSKVASSLNQNARMESGDGKREVVLLGSAHAENFLYFCRWSQFFSSNSICQMGTDCDVISNIALHTFRYQISS